MAKSASKTSGITSQTLLARESWKPLPALVVLAGTASFFKDQVVARFVRELFGDSEREMQRFTGPSSDRNLSELPLSTVLDELRTPSFFASHRLVIVENAAAFVNANRDVLESAVASGFSGGHLILSVEGKLPMTTRFAKAVAASGWLVTCDQPYDRPPPWDTRSPPWKSELSHWLVRRAREKGLRLDERGAFLLHDRLGTDLRLLDEELEKLSTFLAAESQAAGSLRGAGRERPVTEETILRVTGELREDSIFALVDLILERRRGEAVAAVERLFRRGYHNESGALVHDPNGIALPFLSSLLLRLRSLRRAHAMAREGARSDAWIREGLVHKPFLSRFERQLARTAPERVARLIERLYETDVAIKRGGDAHRLLLLLAAE